MDHEAQADGSGTGNSEPVASPPDGMPVGAGAGAGDGDGVPPDGAVGRALLIGVGIVALAAVAVALAVTFSRHDQPVAVGPPATAAVEGVTETTTPSTARPSTTASPPPPTTASPTTAPPTTPSVPTAEAIAPFVAEARAADARVRDATAAVQGSVHETEIVIDQSTADLVHAAQPTAAAAAIPAGLPADVEAATMLVYSGLESRWAAIRCAGPARFARDGVDDRFFAECVRDDSATADRFASDLAALERAASGSPTAAVVPADSRTTAEIAVRVEYINGQNACCMSNGGYLATAPIAIVWNPTPTTEAPGLRGDGQVEGITFQADLVDGRWVVRLNAG